MAYADYISYIIIAKLKRFVKRERWKKSPAVLARVNMIPWQAADAAFIMI